MENTKNNIKQFFKIIYEIYKIKPPTTTIGLQVINNLLENFDFDNLDKVLKKVIQTNKTPKNMVEAVNLFIDLERTLRPIYHYRPSLPQPSQPIGHLTKVANWLNNGGREFHLFLDLLHFNKIKNTTSYSAMQLFPKIRNNIKQAIDTREWEIVENRSLVIWDEVKQEIQEAINSLK